MRATRIAVAGLGIALATAFAVTPAAAATHQVAIEGMKFSPARLEMRAGDTIVWINRDVVPHTVTAPSAKIESGSISPGAIWRHTVKTKGEIDYVCRFHPGMKGVLVVK
jgi:plastocyanin